MKTAMMLLCLLASTAFAQVAIAKPPDLAVLTTVKEARGKRPLNSKILLALKQGPIDPSLAADLLEFDWYRAGAWSYPEKKFDLWYEQEAVSPTIDPFHVERAGPVADAIDEWLALPSDERLALVRQRTGRTEELWNELAGDTGQPEPVLATATNTGWCVIHPDQRFNLTPAMGEAARRMGDQRVLAAVRSALSNSRPR